MYSILAVPPPNPELIINPDVVFPLTLSMYDNGLCDNSTSFNLLGFAKLSLKLKIIVCVDKLLSRVTFISFANLEYFLANLSTFFLE